MTIALDKPARSYYVHGGLAGGSHDVSSGAQRARADDDAGAVHGERSVSADIHGGATIRVWSWSRRDEGAHQHLASAEVGDPTGSRRWMPRFESAAPSPL